MGACVRFLVHEVRRFTSPLLVSSLPLLRRSLGLQFSDGILVGGVPVVPSFRPQSAPVSENINVRATGTGVLQDVHSRFLHTLYRTAIDSHLPSALYPLGMVNHFQPLLCFGAMFCRHKTSNSNLIDGRHFSRPLLSVALMRLILDGPEFWETVGNR